MDDNRGGGKGREAKKGGRKMLKLGRVTVWRGGETPSLALIFGKFTVLTESLLLQPSKPVPSYLYPT